MTPASRDTPRSRAEAAALAALNLPGAPPPAPRGAASPAARAWWAGVLVETAPGAAPRVAARLLLASEIQLCGGDGDRRLALVVEGRGPPEALAGALPRSDPEIVAVHLLQLFEETPAPP